MTGEDSGDGPFRWRRLRLPSAVSVAIVAAAPFLGRVRDLLLELFPSRALTAGTIAFGVLVGGAVLVAVARIRERRWLRYGGLVVCAALVWGQVRGFATGIPTVDVVERVHLLEYGFLAILFYRAFGPLGGPTAALLAALSGVFVGILDEWLQWFVASRVGEVGDVWLNAASVGTGVVFALVLYPTGGLRRRPAAAERSAAFGLAAVVALVFGGFYHCAHLGYEVRDEGAGLTFSSWFPPDELAAVAAERALRWRAGRLPSLGPLRREDRFFLEGTSRVAHRNASLQRQDVRSAWGEQRILERHYAPVLEQRGLHSGEPLGLTAEQREDLRQRAERVGRAAYTSPVLTDRIAIARSKPAWWAAVAVLTTALAGAALWSARRAGSDVETRPARSQATDRDEHALG